jgi:hypothetical protein
MQSPSALVKKMGIMTMKPSFKAIHLHCIQQTARACRLGGSFLARGARVALLLLVLLGATIVPASAEGIPEPSLVYYGVVRVAVTDARLTVGTLQWIFHPVNGGDPVEITTPLTNINDQFSYVLFVPVETALPGQDPGTNTLRLAANPISYDRLEVMVNGQSATLLPPALGTFSLALTDRGKVERIDLTASVDAVDSDGNGLLDAWEIAHFGGIGQDRNGDPDMDGMTNFEEQQAGTDPNDFASQFEFILITRGPQTGITIEWSSVAGRVYTLLRSATVLGGYEPIASGLAATPPSNTFHDANAPGVGTYFYRLQLED